jgi:hypothetical protein
MTCADDSPGVAMRIAHRSRAESTRRSKMPIMPRRADRVSRAIPRPAADETRGRLLAQAAVYVELAVLLPIRLMVAGDVSRDAQRPVLPARITTALIEPLLQFPP